MPDSLLKFFFLDFLQTNYELSFEEAAIILKLARQQQWLFADESKILQHKVSITKTLLELHHQRIDQVQQQASKAADVELKVTEYMRHANSSSTLPVSSWIGAFTNFIYIAGTPNTHPGDDLESDASAEHLLDPDLDDDWDADPKNNKVTFKDSMSHHLYARSLVNANPAADMYTVRNGTVSCTVILD